MKVVKKIEKKIKKSNKKRVKVLSLKRKDFKKELSTKVGFGFQDMKKKPKKIISKLMCKNMNMEFMPKDMSKMEVDIYVSTC